MKEIIKNASNRFLEAGIESANLDARLLMQEAIGKSHEFIVMNPDYELNKAEELAFEEMVQQRVQRLPISHILGRKEFWGMEFEVSGDVLTPRPETEIIIEEVLSHFKGQDELEIIDLGTGSGCILLSLLKEFPKSRGVGVDFSQEALAIAKRNAYNLDIRNAEFQQSNWLTNIEQKNFDLIVSNPPYIPQTDLAGLEKELSFEPEMALTDNNDGLDCYREIAASLANFNFKLSLFEIGINQETEIIQIFENNNLKHLKTIKDLAGIPRILAFVK